MKTSTKVLAGALIGLVTVSYAYLNSGTALAAANVPDNLPFFPQVKENTKITVTTEDGQPAEGITVHRGDVLLVHGSGFSPDANRGGFPLPIPPGTPNGVYVLYSGFPDNWKPSEGAPGSNRTHPHDRMAWVTPPKTLNAIPTMPIDMRRSIARVSQPMDEQGNFTARIVVDPPAETAGKNFGVYVYAGAGSVNPAEEHYVPINYSPEPGPNTPAPAQPDLVLTADAVYRATNATRGGINPRNGAAKQPGNKVSFTRNTDADAVAMDGTKRFKGSITATAKFSLVEVTMKDPWVENRDGKQVLTAMISNAYNTGPDEMHRAEIGTLGAPDAAGEQKLSKGPIGFSSVRINA